MNLQLTEKCFTCLDCNSDLFYNVLNYDTDHISYWEKLQICIGTELLDLDLNGMQICSNCVEQLKISYKFKKLVLASQEVLLQQLDLKQRELDDCTEENSDLDGVVLIKTENFLENESSNTFEVVSNRSDDDDDSNDFIYECDLCNTKFNKEWKLRRHSKRIHNIIHKYTCEHCHKEFKQHFHLKEHLYSHTDEKNFKCRICDRKFQRLSSQRRHESTHSRPPGEKTKRTPFLCTMCGKSFPFSNSVQRHMRVHLDIKQYECKLCKKRFRQSTHLNVHMRTHTGEKPFICDMCGEKFSLKSLLLRHIKIYHGNGQTDEHNDRIIDCHL